MSGPTGMATEAGVSAEILAIYGLIVHGVVNRANDGGAQTISETNERR
jgi:hypothetical protein